MPVGKCEGHPLQRTEGGKKDFHKHRFHLFTWGFSSHLSEKKGSLQKSGLSQARASSFYSSCRVPHLIINRIEE